MLTPVTAFTANDVLPVTIWLKAADADGLLLASPL
jgi:hypothetical protein